MKITGEVHDESSCLQESRGAVFDLNYCQLLIQSIIINDDTLSNGKMASSEVTGTVLLEE